MRLLKQNDTTKAIVFLMVDSSDHITPKTGLSPTVTISKNGGSFASPSGTVSEIGNGWYKLTPASADVNTLGPLILHAEASGADPVDVEYRVVAFDPDSATNLGLSNLDASVSSRSTLTAAQVWSNSTRELTAFAFNVNLNFGQTLPSSPTADTVGAALKNASSRIDTTVSSRSTLTAADVWTYSTRALTSAVDVNMSQTLPTTPTANTVGEALKFADTRLDAAVSSRSTLNAQQVWEYTTRTLTGFTHEVTVGGYASGQSPSEQIVGLGYTASRAAKLDNLDTTIGSRLASTAYTAPDNAGIAGIKVQTDKLRFTGPSGQELVLASASVDEAAIAQAVAQELQGANLVNVIVAPVNALVQTTAGEGGTIRGATYRPLRASWFVRNAQLQGHEVRILVFRENQQPVVYSGPEVVIQQQTIGSLISLNGAANKTPATGTYDYAVEDLTANMLLFVGKVVIYAVPQAN